MKFTNNNETGIAGDYIWLEAISMVVQLTNVDGLELQKGERFATNEEINTHISNKQ